MQLLLGIKISNCPCCDSVNLIRINGVAYNNNYKSLEGYILKKIFNCRKCREELGLFLKEADSVNKKITKVVWLENIACDEQYHDALTKLEKIKNKSIKTKNKKYYQSLGEINDIHKKIRQDKIKLQIKLKIQKKGLLTRYVY